MALKKFCRCGIIISQEIKLCPKCAERQSYLNKESNKEAVKRYSKTRLDAKEQRFYKCNEWRMTREVVKNRDKGVCKRCEYKGRVGFADNIHHIEELKDRWELRININNLICLCDKCHANVHGGYKMNEENKKRIQRELKELIS